MFKKVLAFFVILVGVFISLGGADASQDTDTEPKVVKVVSHHPKHVIVKTIPFEPWATPTPNQVLLIIDIESLGIVWIKDTLLRRVWCESKYNWAAINGQYEGLGQSALSTFNRGVSTIGNRLVKMPGKTLIRYKRIIIDKYWSDGTITHATGKRVRVYIKRTYRGYIPSNPPRTHGWAQIRIMRQAIQGISAVGDSEWSCR